MILFQFWELVMCSKIHSKEGSPSLLLLLH